MQEEKAKPENFPNVSADCLFPRNVRAGQQGDPTTYAHRGSFTPCGETQDYRKPFEVEKIEREALRPESLLVDGSGCTTRCVDLLPLSHSTQRRVNYPCSALQLASPSLGSAVTPHARCCMVDWHVGPLMPGALQMCDQCGLWFDQVKCLVRVAVRVTSTLAYSPCCLKLVLTLP